MARKPTSGGTWDLPKQLGDFELLAWQSGGTLGELFEARRIADDLPCVVRVLPPSLGARLPRLVEEAKAVAGLHHRHVRTVYDMGRHDGAFFVAMEAYDAPTLEAWLAETAQPLDPGQAMEALAQVARALHNAHTSGVIHGHLRADNVLIRVTDDGVVEAKIENFGLEKLRTAAQLVASGTVDRARFLAPEQAQETERADARSDIYAVGAMLYRLVCGRYHVDGETVHEILRHVSAGAWVHPRQADPDLDPDVVAVLERCLAADPEARYQTARAVAADLDRLAKGERPLARDAQRPPTRREAGASARSRWLVVGGAAAAVALAAGLAPLFFGGGTGADSGTGAGTAGGATTDPAPAVTSARPPDRPADPVPPPPDPGPEVRRAATALLEAGDAAKAVATLSTHLVEHPDDAAALVLRGRANAARGAAEPALADLDRAQELLGTEAPAAADARAQACWTLVQAAFAADRFDDATHARLDRALQHAAALPRPVDPVTFLEARCRGNRALLDGWPALVEAQLPAGGLRDYLRVSERLSGDPVPDDEAAVYAQAIARWPEWADPLAHEALRRRAAGDVAAARAMLARAEAADPEHPAVTLARCCFDLLDGTPGAIARAIETWKRVRGADPHHERLFYFGVRDRLREARGWLPAAAVALRYLHDGDDGALAPVLQFFYEDLAGGLMADLQHFAAAAAPAEGGAAALHAAVTAFLDPAAAPAAVTAPAVRALDDDPLGRHAEVLGALSLHDPRRLLSSLVPRLGPGRTPFHRVADAALDLARAAGQRGDLEQARAGMLRALAISPDVQRLQHAMDAFGSALMRHGHAAYAQWFLEFLQPHTAPERSGEPVALAACLWSARVHEKLEAWGAARDAFTAAMDAMPDNPSPLLWRASYALRRGEPDRAQVDCDTLVALHPDFGLGWFVRGVAHQVAGDVEAAHEDYHAALEAKAGSAAGVCEALAGLAALRLGAAAHAAVHLDRVATARGDGAKLAFLVRGAQRMAAGDRVAALEDLADAAMLPASTWERELPLAPLLTESQSLLAAESAAVADVLLGRAEQAFTAGERPTAAAALKGCVTLPSRDEGRYQYCVARWHAARGAVGADSALEALEHALEAGYRPMGGFGAEPEFDALRGSDRFVTLSAEAKER